MSFFEDAKNFRYYSLFHLPFKNRIEWSRGTVVATGERSKIISLVFHRSGRSLLPQKRQWNVGELSLHGNPVVATNRSLGCEGGGKKVIDGEQGSVKIAFRVWNCGDPAMTRDTEFSRHLWGPWVGTVGSRTVYRTLLRGSTNSPLFLRHV